MNGTFWVVLAFRSHHNVMEAFFNPITKIIYMHKWTLNERGTKSPSVSIQTNSDKLPSLESYHRCHAALFWWLISNRVDGCDRLSPGRNATGKWRLEWPGSWPAAGWARWWPPAHKHGSLQTGSDPVLIPGTRNNINKPLGRMTLKKEDKTSISFFADGTYRRWYLHADRENLLVKSKTSCRTEEEIIQWLWNLLFMFVLTGWSRSPTQYFSLSSCY